MIRPITLICWILALSAGLYLYRAKHEVELIDQHIDQIAKQTADLRIESRGLLDEWIRLGEPEQLHKYSDEYLGLQPIAPGQFARLSDLPSRLPPPQADPPDVQADVVAQSSGVASPDVPVGGGVQPAAVEPTVEEDTSPESATADGLPIPPIPPAEAPAASASERKATALPLQAKPVTPRLTDGQTNPEAEPARASAGATAHAVDEPRTGLGRMAPVNQAEARPAPVNPPPIGPAGWQAHGMPPLQAQGPTDFPGLPPLQAQASRELAHTPGRVPGPGEGSGRISGPPPGQAFGQAPAHPADARANEPQREIRPLEPQPGPRQAAEPRGSETQIARQGPNQMPGMGPPAGGSLLGMSRGSVPLPAPMPVNANWSGQAGPGSLGPGSLGQGR
jgi:hypothetical protein